ncbi:MAG: hypothetical protein MK102_12575 [Fuerstiella sp.]|nr:hypothetical protein [Fuerstiella sp.]
MNKVFVMAFVLSVALLSGCSDPEAPITTDMHEDFTHDHQHRHGATDDHEHDHGEDLQGSHSHDHSHGHRHGKPLHGGRIVSIGHAHHKDGATHFHAEILPLIDNTVRCFLQIETKDGETADYRIKESEIEALLSVKGREWTSRNRMFIAVNEGECAEFVMELPKNLENDSEFSVAIPKIELGGQRQNFSFKITRESVAEGEATTEVTSEESQDGE